MPAAKTRPMRSSRAIVSLVTVVLGVAALTGYFIAVDQSKCDEPFDRAAWDVRTATKPTEDGRSRRSILADRLTACENLDGAPRTRVRQVLGEPDRTSRTVDGAQLWVYLLGPGALMLDDEELVVRFSEQQVDKTYRTH